MKTEKMKTTSIHDDNFDRFHETMKGLEGAGYRVEELRQEIIEDVPGWFCKMVKYA